MSERKTRQDGLGRDPDGSSSQASPEAASHLRPAGFDPSRMQWQPIATAPKDGTPFIAYWLRLDPSGKRYEAMQPYVIAQSHRGRFSPSWIRSDDPPTHWMPLPPAPGGEARSAETQGGSVHEHPITEGEAPINSAMLSALQSADASMTLGWTDPSHADAQRELGSEMCEIWTQIRSVISQAERE